MHMHSIIKDTDFHLYYKDIVQDSENTKPGQKY